jgi:hypothetical protein
MLPRDHTWGLSREGGGQWMGDVRTEYQVLAQNSFHLISRDIKSPALQVTKLSPGR